jgi:hypothetical protein
MNISIIYYNSKITNLKSKYCTKKNLKTLSKIAAVTIGITIMTGNVPILAATNIDKSIKTANDIGSAAWKILLTVGYWACAIYASKDMIADMGSSDIKEIVKTGTKYLVGYAFIYFFINFLDMIRSFGGK